MKQKKIEKVIEWLEKISGNWGLERVLRAFYEGGIRSDIDITGVLCVFENSAMLGSMSDVAGPLYDKVCREYHELTPRSEEEKREYKIVDEQYSMIITFFELIKQYNGEPDIKKKLEAGLDSLRVSLKQESVTADQGERHE